MKFSIVIPVYNVAPYLRGCLDSVLAAVERLGGGSWSEEREVGERMDKHHSPTSTLNSNFLVEIICVDDGSTDGSGEILDEYREKVEKVGGGGDERKVMGKGSDPLPERWWIGEEL